ncbi:MAG: anthranilate synthase component I [Verrucomicrobiota bacterium]|nr:anthranilate synthase component I [Verrucomicrobiota bacterium]
MLAPSREKFIELAKDGNLIPVFRELLADTETPVTAYLKLDEPDKISFLLESAESAERFGRYSFIASAPELIFEMRGDEVRLVRNGKEERYKSQLDPLAELQKIMSVFKPVEHTDLPIFYGGAVGYLAYETVRFFEKTVPKSAKDDLQVPDALFVISDTVLIFDHVQRRIKVLCNAHVEGDAGSAYDIAAGKIDAVVQKLKKPAVSLPIEFSEPDPAEPELPKANMTQADYVRMTESMQEYIKAGDIFQVVPSQRFEVPFTGRPIDLYRALRLINPSPYMFCLKFLDMAVVGTSPEVHVRCENRKVEIRPIAGTRVRGKTPEEDDQLAAELLADPKERAEHVMLVDLARNDVGRVCDYNSVRVTEFMIIERYSHVMHIVSNVEGILSGNSNAYDVMRATFPAGTVSGSPKIRAMQIIAEQEPTSRGIYAGAVGYFGYSGNLDSCIAIRTLLLKNDKAYLQAGGGLVADSTALGEYHESCNKAKAGLKALRLAAQISSA